MIPLLPFPGWIVHPDWADRVVAPFLDQVAPEDRARIVTSNPDSYLHVSRPANLGEDPVSVLAGNRAAIDRLIGAGAYRHDEEPAMYVYEQREGPFVQTGIVAEVPVPAFADGRVLGHEDVQPERVESLADHIRTVGVRSELVALMDGSSTALDRIRSDCLGQPPILELTFDGIAQTVWRVSGDAISSLSRGIGEGSLYITDGHHRVAASIRLWEEAGRPEHHRVLCVVYPHIELRMVAFDRRVQGPLDAEKTLATLFDAASVEPADGPSREPGVFSLYLAGGWHRLVPRERAYRAGVEGLDVTALHRDLLGALGVEAEDPRLEFVPALMPLDELVRRCDGDGGAIFVLHPPSLGQLKEVADRGEVMPPKATYFHPKPLTGLIVRFNDPI